MGRQLFWGSNLVKQWNIFTVLAGLALLLLYAIFVFGVYLQSVPAPRVQLDDPLIKSILLRSAFSDDMSKACKRIPKCNRSSNISLANIVWRKIADFVKKLSGAPDNNPLSLNKVSQQEASLLYYVGVVVAAPEGSAKRERAQRELDEELSSRTHFDCAIREIGKVIFDTDDYYERLMAIRSPFVDDWNCYETMITTYETHCGAIIEYAFSYLHAFANMCNAGIQPPRLSEVASQVCANVGKIIPECVGK